MTQKELNQEIERCIKSPYYFFKKYCYIKADDGRKMPAETSLNEEQFNSLFRSLVKNNI